MPVIFNTTILNGMGVIGYIESPPTWHPANEEGNLLSIHFIQMSYGLGLIGTWRSAREEGEVSSSRSKYLGGLFYRDEIDMSFLVATSWIVPAGFLFPKYGLKLAGFQFDLRVCVVGVLVLPRIWRIMQKGRRRRMASGSNRSG
ncbi:hypothetical protein Bca4012_011690 [Brassica carinata]